MSKIKVEFLYKVFFLSLLLSLVSCGSESSQSSSRPPAFGKLNDVVVISDSTIWNGFVGDTLIYYLSSAYPVLTAPEPILDLRHFTLQDMDDFPVRKELRVFVVMADLDDPESPTTKMVVKDIGEERYQIAMSDSTVFNSIGRDKWAHKQLFVYIYGRGKERLADNISKSWKSIVNKISEFDNMQLESNLYLPGRNQDIEKKIAEKYNVDIKIPKSYFIAIDQDNDLWIRLETNKYSANLLMTEIPYLDEGQLSQPYMKYLQDSLGKKYVSSTIEGTFKQTNDIDLPMLVEAVEGTKSYTLEARGVWEMENDFMGGPFSSRLILSPEKDRLFFLEAFLYAPGMDKRDVMQELNLILSTANFKE